VARSKQPEPRTAQLSIDAMKAAVPKIERRIKDLESFDVASIRERLDPVVDGLVRKIDGTLQDILGHGTVEYNEYSIGSLDTLPLIMGGGPNPLSEVHRGYRDGIEGALVKLRTLKELFEERIADAPQAAAPHRQKSDLGNSRRVFVVHGRDEGTKEAVARYLAKLDLDPIILHEEPNKGKTIIEKFESHADVAFAVVLFTPDDVGYPAGESDKARLRARQNVVLELGFFAAALGRHRVCVLFKGDIEIPSDYAGVAYVPLDGAGAWRLLVAREIRGAGIDVDLNKAL
jgi:predicted nucleotide-binding protein